MASACTGLGAQAGKLDRSILPSSGLPTLSQPLAGGKNSPALRVKPLTTLIRQKVLGDGRNASIIPSMNPKAIRACIS